MRKTVLAAALCVGFAMAEPTARAASDKPSGAEADSTAKASEKYRAGMDLFQAQKFEEALAAFRESYDLVKSPNSHLMIARSLSKLGKNAEAYAEITRAIPEAEAAAEENDKYKKTADAMRTERDEMKGRVGFLVVGVKMDVSVAGRAIGADELGHAIVVEPGSTEVTLKLPSGQEARQTVEVKAGEQASVELTPPAPPAPAPPPPPPPPPPPAPSGIDPRTLAFVTGGIGVAGMAAFGLFGLLDNSKYDDLKSRCAANVCSRGDSDTAETGREYQALANVGLGVGIVGLATGVILFVAAPSRPKEKPAAASFDVGPRSVAFRGNF